MIQIPEDKKRTETETKRELNKGLNDARKKS